MEFNTRRIDLDRLNSLTKYPSIELFHKMGSNYKLTNERNFSDLAPETDIWITEKIDGTNARIILLPDGYYLLGSREELLLARGDLVGNPSQQIVATIKWIAERIPDNMYRSDAITVIFGEAYGGKGISQNSKQYSLGTSSGYRVFDVMMLPLDQWNELQHWEPKAVALWREQGNQQFLNNIQRIGFIDDVNYHGTLTLLTQVPRLSNFAFGDLPTTVADMYQFMLDIQDRSDAVLDNDAPGMPEGIVLRNFDRTFIAKARREDYMKTLGIRK